MKKSILLFCILLFTISMQGQSTMRVMKGYVMDQEGQGLADKKVEARYYDCADESFQEIVIESTSDAEGYYELWLDICDNEPFIVISYCGGVYQCTDGLSFYNDHTALDFNFDCNYDFNCDASFTYTYGEPELDSGAIPFYFEALNPNDEDYMYEWAFLGAVDVEGDSESTPVVHYPIFGQYTICMQTYYIGDPYNIVCEFCESINADLAFQSFGTTNTESTIIAQSINAYPNPVHDKVYLDFDLIKDQNVIVEVRSHTGHLIKQSDVYCQTRDNQVILDFSAYASGIYLIRVVSTSGAYTKKVCKE